MRQALPEPARTRKRAPVRKLAGGAPTPSRRRVRVSRGRPPRAPWYTPAPMSPTLGHTWRPLEVPSDPAALASPDIRAFTKVWQRQRARLSDLEILGVFQERLARQWSIETGVLERLYDLSRGLTVTLIEQGFHASLVAHGDATISGERLVEVLQDHREGLDMVMDLIAGSRDLSVGWIKELHALFTRHQASTEAITPTGQRVEVPLIRGAFKQRPNNPLQRDGSIHEYAPPEHVPSEMDRLVAGYHALSPELPEVRAAWLHHRFTQIHPFQDGNGRVARALASLEFIRAGLLPLLVERDDRDTRYIPALEAADHGDLRPLVEFFADCMSRVLLRASAEAELLISAKRDVQDILRAGRKKIQARVRTSIESEGGQEARLQLLGRSLCENFEAFQAAISAEFPEVLVSVRSPGVKFSRQMFHHQILQLAQHRDYGVSINAPRTWAWMRLQTERERTEIVTSIHALSGPSDGMWALDVLLLHEPLGGSADTLDVLFLDVEPLLLSIDEAEPDQLQRLRAWFDVMKVQAAAQWIQFL